MSSSVGIPINREASGRSRGAKKGASSGGSDVSVAGGGGGSGGSSSTFGRSPAAKSPTPDIRGLRTGPSMPSSGGSLSSSASRLSMSSSPSLRLFRDSRAQGDVSSMVRAFLIHSDVEQLRSMFVSLPANVRNDVQSMLDDIADDEPYSSTSVSSRERDAEADWFAAYGRSPAVGWHVSPSSQSIHSNHTTDSGSDSSDVVGMFMDEAPESQSLSGASRPTVDIIVPSLSVDQKELEKLTGALLYEERLLHNLIRLRDPSLRIIYITSVPLHPSVVEYYLNQLPADVRRSANSRLVLMSTFDSSRKPLTRKMLERPRFLATIRRHVARARAGGADVDVSLTIFIPTQLEHRLATELDVPINASSLESQHWGTKCGSRKIFRDTGVPHPYGTYESVYNRDDLVEQIVRVWKETRGQFQYLVVKLNDGFSGSGNAILDLKKVTARMHSNTSGFKSRQPSEEATENSRRLFIAMELKRMRFQMESDRWEEFYEQIQAIGCIVEVFIPGKGKTSPSVQACIHPDKSVEILSSHEQVLGGPDGQVFLGCKFPCIKDYRIALHRYTRKIGEMLAERGAMDRFGVDFLAVPNTPGDYSDCKLFALEINLRQGGTTHPYEALRSLTRGSYGEMTGVFLTPKGTEKHYVASDNLKEPSYKGLLPSDLISIIKANHLEYDKETQTGCLFHLISALSEFGKVGVTCIANTSAGAEELFERIIETLDRETISSELPDDLKLTAPGSAHNLDLSASEML